MLIQLTCKIEKSDHEGYCSDAECEYEQYNQTETLEIPDDFQFNSIMTYEWSDKQLEKFDPKVYKEGSFYCSISPESIEHGLGYHDFKITPISITIPLLK